MIFELILGNIKLYKESLEYIKLGLYLTNGFSSNVLKLIKINNEHCSKEKI